MSDKVVDPENARLVAMLRALGEEVPEDLLRKPATDEEIIAKIAAMTKEEVDAVLAKVSANGVKKSGESWTLEMDLRFRDADESNEPDYLRPVRKPKYYANSVTVPKL